MKPKKTSKALLGLSMVGAGAVVGAGAPCVAYAKVYMQEEDVHQAYFAGEKFTRLNLPLSEAEIAIIEKAGDERVRNKTLVAWVSEKKNVVFIDQVLGKHEFITYAVAIAGEGAKVRGIEILEYRETYGDQIRDAAWRQQFVGKDKTAPLRVKKDIANIGGATLSSSHVASGVRRLLQSYDVVRKRL